MRYDFKGVYASLCEIEKIYCSFHLLEIVIKNIANMHRKHDVQAFSNIVKNIVGQCFCQDIALTSHR